MKNNLKFNTLILDILYRKWVMFMIKELTKTISLQYTGQSINLPSDLKEKIQEFWDLAVKENPALYNGEYYAVEKIEETENKITMSILKTSYSHYLYDERIGIDDEQYKCNIPWSGILLLTLDNYWVFGQSSKNTSFPDGFQISGGGIDSEDITGSNINLVQNLKRELKEEMNLDLDEIEYNFKYIEYPNKNRNAYGIIAIGKLNMSKDELYNHFEKYKEYLKQNHLEIEFNNLIFLKKGNAIKELDKYTNPKRVYLRELISKEDYEETNL